MRYYLFYLLKKVSKDVSRNKGMIFGLVLILLSIFFLTRNIELTVIVALAGLWVICNWNIQVIIVISLITLLTVPIGLIFGQRDAADTLAKYTYYLLALATGLHVVEFIKLQWYKFIAKRQSVKPSIKNFDSNNQPSLEIPNSTKTQPVESTPTPQIPSKPNTRLDYLRKLRRSNYRYTTDYRANSARTIDQSQTESSISEPAVEENPQTVTFDWWFWLLGLATFGFSYFVFQFQPYPAFRDFVALPQTYNININYLSVGLWLESLANLSITWGFPSHVFWSSWFQIVFGFGVMVTYQSLRKILTLFSGNCPSWVLALISFIYLFNSFTFERFLMGHQFFLLGHVVMVPVFYHILKFWTRFSEFDFRSQRLYLKSFPANIGIFLSPIISLAFIAWINIHHAVFLYVILGCLSMIGIGFTLKKLVNFPPFTRIIIQTWHWVCIPLLLCLPSIILLISSYLYHQNDLIAYYTENIQNTDSTLKIVEAFSPKIRPGENLLIRVLVGSASWNTPTFFEVTSIQKQLDWLGPITVYFNPILAGIVIFLGLILLANLLFSKKNWLDLLACILIPTALVASFGLSGWFAHINQFLYLIPGSYIMREPGKFYGLFLLISLVWLSFRYQNHGRFLRSIQVFLALLLAINSIVLFWPLSNHLNYVSYPKSIQNLGKDCRSSDQVLFLPLDGYILPHYSPKIFVLNRIQNAIPCRVLIPIYTTVSTENDAVLLSEGVIDKQIQDDIEQLLKSKDSKKFISSLKSKGITILILETYLNPKLQEVNQLVEKEVKPKSTEKTLSIYYFR